MHDGRILDLLRADDAINAWFAVMTILPGVGAPILHRYDVRRVLNWIAFIWFVPGMLLLEYRSGHLRLRSRACSLHVSPRMQTTTRRFDFGIAGAVTSCPRLSGCFRIFGDIETHNGARDTSRGSMAERNQCYKSQECSSHHRDPP
jgi:hypothetical protein